MSTARTGEADPDAGSASDDTNREAGEAPAPSTHRPGAGYRLRWWREVLYIVLVYLAYSFVRNQFGSASGGLITAEPAYDNAVRVIELQQQLGLYFEPGLQEWYLDLPANGLIRFWNVLYGLAHFVVAAAALIWMFRSRPDRYRLWRNTLAFTTLLALVGFAAFSLMPPRLLDDPGTYGGCQVYAESAELPEEPGAPPCDEYGFVDTIDVYGGWASFGSDEMAQVSNQFAAMPSMHIGWSMWCAFVIFPLARRKVARSLAIMYPVVTLFDIIVTANHYWIDAAGGAVCLGVGYLIARLVTPWFEARVVTP